MSHVTIECPDCNIEHTRTWKQGTFLAGEIICGCDTVITFRVQLTARGKTRDSLREEVEKPHG